MVDDIKGVSLGKIQEYLKEVKSKKSKSKENVATDKVNISSLSKKISETASQPLFREDKIEKAKIRLKENFYSTKTKEIAENILKELLG